VQAMLPEGFPSNQFNIQEIKRNVTKIGFVTFVTPYLPGSMTVWNAWQYVLELAI